MKENQSLIRLFADDTTLYIIVDRPYLVAQILNNDVQRISVWSELWLVKFNPKKTETMLCTCKRNRVIHQSLSFYGEIIKEVTSHKHLGLNLTNSCDWPMHINYIEEKSLKPLTFTTFP